MMAHYQPFVSYMRLEKMVHMKKTLLPIQALLFSKVFLIIVDGKIAMVILIDFLEEIETPNFLSFLL